jgi:hypothetical protein
MALDITLYDVDGKNPKMVESVAGVQVTTVRNNGDLFRTSGQAADFVRLELLVDEILHPIPDEFLRPDVKLTEEKPSVAKMPLDCINPSLPAPPTSVISVGRQLSFCLKRDTESLLVSYAPGDVINFRRQTGTFQSREIAVNLQVLSGKTLRAESKVTKLETFTPQPDTFAPASDMSAFSGPISAEPRDLINTILSKTSPSYPVGAKARGVGGSVNFDALIGADGRIVSLQPSKPADSELTVAAQEAVRQWIYHPFLVCGIPVPVKTIITVNFNLGS